MMKITLTKWLGLKGAKHSFTIAVRIQTLSVR